MLPTSLAVDFQNFYQHQKSTVSRIAQLVVAELMESGYFVKHIEKMRTLYRKKWKTLIEALQVYLTDEFKIFGDTAGLPYNYLHGYLRNVLYKLLLKKELILIRSQNIIKQLHLKT
ncbi:hypothetical protein [Ureibacillus thermosphaericus]|uniref:hypothetical protein n=1 Tax=Ureibacillus thermosphaericus TaxID=51173 RepID=UPI0030CA0E3C